MNIIRVLIPGDDQSEKLISQAFVYADQLCKRSKGVVEEVILFVPGKESVRSTTLSSALGEKSAKKLLDGDVILLPSGIPMRLESIRTLKWVFKPSVIVAVYADQRMLDQVDAIKNLFGVVAVPHMPAALERWEKTWSPLVHGLQKSAPLKLIRDPVVEQALISLTSSINLSHSLLNPRDRENVEKTLRVLRANGHMNESGDIRAWAIRNGWQPPAATELEKLASKAFGLKSKPRLSEPDSAKRLYDYWRSKVP